MNCFIGLGSNIGDRRENLEKAASAVVQLSRNETFRISPPYETPALVPAGAPLEWRRPYLNAVMQIKPQSPAQELMDNLKRIEREAGRIAAPRWAPRILDLDLLAFGNEIIQDDLLRVPHPGICDRSFVLDPLKDLAAQLCIPGTTNPSVIRARKLKTRLPWIMGIVNLTPDSFSEDRATAALESAEAKILRMENLGIHAIDLGAESTRPGATAVTVEEEMHRLEPILNFLKSHYKKKLIRPFISVDTRKSEIAQMALACGVNCINDVSGLADPAMLDLLRDHSCDYVLMHGLTVPADPRVTLAADCDPVHELKNWLFTKLEMLESKGINLNRVIFDPGIGFGKTPQQSILILRRMNEFSDLPIRLLVGHSRKSFLKTIGAEDLKSKDAATLALSLELLRKGVDILRVHDFEGHIAAFKIRSAVLQ